METDNLVSFENLGETYTGRLSLIVRSTVSPEFDLAYVDLEGHWKICLLSEIKYL